MDDDSYRMKWFLHHYNATLVNDSRRCVQSPEYKFFTDPTHANLIRDSRDYFFRDYQDRYLQQHSYERLMTIEVPESSLRYMAKIHEKLFNGTAGNPENYARTLMQKEWAEHDIRSKNPAVQAAWEHYSLMLHLASNGKELD